MLHAKADREIFKIHSIRSGEGNWAEEDEIDGGLRIIKRLRPINFVWKHTY